MPLPPRRLRARTGAPEAAEWTTGGARAAAELEGCLGEAGLSAHGSILDFGCGAGRVLPHVARRAAGSRCTGCDVDGAAVRWAAEHHPALRFLRSHAEPPLPFPEGTFDLIYSISVFSHLDEGLADRWLAELARVLVPGGRALLSVHGTYAFEQFRAGRVRTNWCEPQGFVRGPLAPDEIVYVPYVRTVLNRADLPGVSPSYGLTFHGERYLAGHWSRFLDVERVVPRALTDWQDVVVCRRAG